MSTDTKPPEPKKPAKTETKTPKKPNPTPTRRDLEGWKVVLENDSVNDFYDVVSAVSTLTNLSKTDSYNRVMEAHKKGRSVLLVTHKERAELYQEQFASHTPVILVKIEKD